MPYCYQHSLDCDALYGGECISPYGCPYGRQFPLEQFIEAKLTPFHKDGSQYTEEQRKVIKLKS